VSSSPPDPQAKPGARKPRPCLSGSGETERSPNRVSLTGRERIEIDDFEHG